MVGAGAPARREAVIAGGGVIAAARNGSTFTTGGVGDAPADRGILIAGDVGDAATDRGKVAAGFIVRPATDSSMGGTGHIGFTAANVGGSTAGYVAHASTDGGVRAAGLVVLAPTNSSPRVAGGVEQPPANGSMGPAGFVAHPSTNRGARVAGDVEQATTDGGKVGRHLVDGAGLSPAANRGTYHTTGDVIAVVASDPVGAGGVGLQPQGALVIHPYLQGHVVRSAQEVGAGVGAHVAGEIPAIAGPGTGLFPMRGNKLEVGNIDVAIAIHVTVRVIAGAGDTAPACWCLRLQGIDGCPWNEEQRQTKSNSDRF